MNDTKRLTDLLSCAIQIMGRLAIPPENVSVVVGNKKKLLAAYNLCDGTLTQKEIAKKIRLDPGNFSRTSNRWVKNGVAFWIGEGNESRLLHLYPLPDVLGQRQQGGRKRRVG
jgi:hypothetical protein